MAVTINGTTGVAVPLGTAAAPGVVNTTSATTGIYNPTSTTLGLSTNGANAVYIDASQNVGIGTASPGVKLDVQAGTNATARVKSTSSGYALFDIDSFTANQPILRYLANGTESARIFSPINEAANQLSFGTGSSGTERMRIDSSGNLLMNRTVNLSPTPGKIAISYLGSAGFGIGIQDTSGGATNYGIVFVSSAGTTVGNISSTSSATAYNTASDYRLKNSIAPMESGLATVAALKPVTYKWNVDDSSGEGFIAHELQSVIPHAVTGTKDAVDDDGKPIYQGVDYSKIVVHLVAAIQELSAEVEALKAKVGA